MSAIVETASATSGDSKMNGSTASMNFPVPTSLSNDSPTWLKSHESNSRRGSLAAPPGLAHPNGVESHQEEPMPKFTRAASVSFFPQAGRTENMDELTYLRHLASLTAQIQTSMPLNGGPPGKFDGWANDERARTSSWNSLHDSGLSTQKEFTSFNSFSPQRRMSYNPAGGMAPRFRGMNAGMPVNNMSSFRGSVFNAFEGESLSPTDSGFGRSFGPSSRRGSFSSSTPTQPTSLGNNESLASNFSGQGSRRYSLAPQFGSDWDYNEYLSSQMENMAINNYNALNRRHSVAASAFPPRRPSPPTSDSNDGYKSLQTLNEDDDSSQFKMDLDLPGSSVTNHLLPECYYVVEFKSGRTDVYFTPAQSFFRVKIGDLVIVEADRGKDLGKVIQEKITAAQLAAIQHEQRLKAGDTPRSLEPKKIFRLAQPSEVSLLVTKCQDEARALQLCQAKIRQHNLNMEVVDAEYQWDRHKLTFYFIAEERIDFRELVKDLFKMYKTRIWMCAVTPSS